MSLKQLTMLAAIIALAVVSPARAAHAQAATYEEAIQNLRHPDVEVRLTALRSLREGGQVEAIGPIAALVTDAVTRVQIEALRTELGFFAVDPPKGRRHVALIVEVRDSRDAMGIFDQGPLATVPHPVPPDLVRALVEATKDDDRQVRVDAVYLIGVAAPAPSKPLVDRLVSLLGSQDPVLRRGGARVLGRLRAREAAPTLIYGMNDPVLDVRVAAMEALGEIGEPTAIQALTERAAYYGSSTEGLVALAAAARIGSPSTLPLFRERLADRNARLRLIAAEGLGYGNDTESAAALEKAVGSEKSTGVRLAMIFALRRVGQGDVHPLIEALVDPATVRQARDYLVALGAPVVPSLVEYVQNPEPQVRAAVADILGGIGGASANGALETLRQDPDPAVAAAAQRALARVAQGRSAR